ncbi:ribokinase, partial [Kibdelosporangium persicum]
ANVDLVVDVPRPPRGGETILGGDLRRNPGGKGANQAVAAALAGGAETTFVGALGADDSADLLLTSLERAGVRTDLTGRADAPTGTALITVSPDGENTIVVAPGANARLELDTARTARIAAADVVLAQLEIPLDVVRGASAARGPGVLMALNAAPAQALPDDVWDAIDLLIVNEHEAVELTQAAGSAAELAAMLLERVSAVVITLGRGGCVVAEKGRDPLRIPGFSVDAVDTTGAGDTFCGVLAAALARGLELAEAARLACAAGALAVTRPGAQSAVPTAAEVAALAALDSGGDAR